MKNFAAMLLLAGSFWGLSPADEVRLKDGSVLQGTVLSESDSTVVVSTQFAGILRIPADLLEKPVPKDSSRAVARAPRPAAGRNLDPAGHALFFLPTAFVPPQGAATFRDFELFFLTFGYSVTNSTVISGGFFFPISSDFQIVTAGFKHQLWRSADSRGALALTGNFTKPFIEGDEDLRYLVNSNLVAGVRFPSDLFADAAGLHGALGYAGAALRDEVYDESLYDYRTREVWDDRFSWGGGMELRLTGNSKFMMELLSATPLDVSDDNVGIFTVGIRLHGEGLSADIAGFRPMNGSDDGLLFWPLLNIGYTF